MSKTICEIDGNYYDLEYHKQSHQSGCLLYSGHLYLTLLLKYEYLTNGESVEWFKPEGTMPEIIKAITEAIDNQEMNDNSLFVP